MDLHEEAERLARTALGIEWKYTESAARRVAECAAVRLAEVERHKAGLLAVCGTREEIIQRLTRERDEARAQVADALDSEAAFERVWAVVREWDISTEPGAFRLYEGINGDHVRAIVNAALNLNHA